MGPVLIKLSFLIRKNKKTSVKVGTNDPNKKKDPTHMEQKKLRSKVQIKKFLKDNKEIIKGLEKKIGGAERYTREPWMTESNPIDDKYEEFLYKESDSL